MRNFLLSYAPVLMWVLTILEFTIGILCMKKRKGTLSRICAYVCFGLCIDALIQASGVLIGEGTILKSISQIRYILSGILIPLLIPIPFYAMGLKNKVAKTVLWVVTGFVILTGIYMGVMTKTEPAYIAGVLRYASSDLTPALASRINRIQSIGGVIPLILVGIAHLIKNRSPFILLSGLFMFVFSALAPITHNMDLNFIITMFGELFMISFFYLELSVKRK